jgi:hypothetical protein
VYNVREGEGLKVGNRRREEKTVRLERGGGVILCEGGKGERLV